ncbi:MAG: ABC transporter substrate-binding protein [Mariprofundaceae bacterium]
MASIGFVRALLCAGLVVLAGACSQQAPRHGELRVGLAQAPMSLDPRFATDAASHRVQELLHCSLVKLDEHFQPQAEAAAGWRHPDPLTWVFTLQQDLFFHDGSPVLAGDVAATIEAVLDEKLASPLRAGFSAVQALEVRSDLEFVLHLSRPDASLLTRLAIGILPRSWASRPHVARDAMGCGPFRLTSWPQAGPVLQRTAPGKASDIREIRFMTVKDPITRALKLARGELDLVQGDLPPHVLTYLRQRKDLRLASHPSTTFSYIGLNLQDAVLKDVRVRRALALAVDRKRLKKALLADLPTLAETVLSPSHWAATSLPSTAFDPEQAERLLEAAGYPRGEDGMRLHLNYRTSTNPTRLKLVTAIAEQWRGIGVDVRIESLEWGGFYARIKRGDFQLFSLSWVGIQDPDIYRLILHTDMWPPNGANRGRYGNEQVDSWLDGAAQSASQQEQRALYARVQQQMARDQVYIPLWYEPVVVVHNVRLQGFEPTSDGSYRGLPSATLQP